MLGNELFKSVSCQILAHEGKPVSVPIEFKSIENLSE